MNKEAPLLWRYVRRVFRYWWVGVVEAVLVLTDFVERILGTWYVFPLWAKVAIGSGVLVVAQWLAYRELATGKDMLQAELDEATRGAAVRRPVLAIHPQAGSAFYIHIGDQRRILGVYLQLWFNVENNGDVNSIVRRFDIFIEETRQEIENAQPAPRNYVLTRQANHALPQNWIAADNTILVGAHNYRSGILPFYTEAVIADDVQLLHCRLTLQDTEGTRAVADFVLARVG